MLAGLGRYDDRVGEQIVDEIATHGAEIAEIAHLYRGGAQRQDMRPRLPRVAAEIDGDVDFELPGERGDLEIGLPVDRQKAVECRLDARPQPVTDVGAQ